MGKIISFMHISLDGFVAGLNGEMNWIKGNEEIFDYAEKRISRTEISLYGRVTFEMMESYWPTAAQKPDASKHDVEHSKWYKNVRKIVLSKTLKSADFENTIILNNEISDKLIEIKTKSDKEILLFGSPTATNFLMKQNLIDGFWLFVNPIVLGQGIPLFKDITETIPLKLKETNIFSSGVIAMNYEVAHD